MPRKILFWSGWVILFALPVIFGIEVYRLQDLPHIEPWKWLVPFVAVALIYFSREKDDVLKHHLA